MSASLKAAAVAGAIALAALLLGGYLGIRLFAEAEGMAALGAGLILLLTSIIGFVVVPLVAGLFGGLISHRPRAVLGSIAGVWMAVVIVAMAVGSGIELAPETVVPAGAVAILVAAGHLTGAILRPRAATL